MDPKGLIAVITLGAGAVRALLALLRSPIGGRVLERLPKDVRPLVPLAMAALVAAGEHFASGGDLVHAVTIALGVFAGSEVSYRVQRGRAKRIAAGSIQLGPGD